MPGDQIIVCPNCHEEIPLNEAITHQLREEIESELTTEFKKREKALRAEIEKTAKVQAEEKCSLEINDLKNQIEEGKNLKKEIQQKELDLLAEKRKLAGREEALNLEIEKRLDEEKQKIESSIRQRIDNEHQLKISEKEAVISGLNEKIKELQRKAEQGSQQIQGEVFETQLEEVLTDSFRGDKVIPVSKGSRGADVLHQIYNQSGLHCGTIIWEAKNAKNWTNKWITKLKSDQRDVKADIAVLLTTTLPPEIQNFAFVDGVWVTDSMSVLGLATALRINLIQVAVIKQMSVGKNEKLESLYQYLLSPEFRQKIEVIAESFITMKTELDQEKRAMQGLWEKREKRINAVVNATAGMYGSLQGIMGKSLESIEQLELPALEDEH